MKAIKFMAMAIFIAQLISCDGSSSSSSSPTQENQPPAIPNIEQGGAVWTMYWGANCTLKRHDYITNSDIYADVSGLKEHRWVFRQNSTDVDELSFFEWCVDWNSYIDAGSITGNSLSLNIYDYCHVSTYCKAQGLGQIKNSGQSIEFDTLWQFCREDLTPDFDVSYYEETQCSATFILE